MKRLLRNGAGILFVLSLIVFVSYLAFQIVLMREVNSPPPPPGFPTTAPPLWISLVEALAVALSAAAVPFFGACVIDRLDSLIGRKEAAE